MIPSTVVILLNFDNECWKYQYVFEISLEDPFGQPMASNV